MGPLLNLSKIDAAEIIESLYVIFHRDFVAQRTELPGHIWVNPESHRLDEGKEKSFWHLTTRNHDGIRVVNGRAAKVKERLTDFRRCERLEWVKLIIDGHDTARVRCFYHRENNDKKNIRLYLWAHQHDFVVILQRLGNSSSFMVTSFYLDYDGKRKEYQRRYNHYNTRTDQHLKGCEWF